MSSAVKFASRKSDDGLISEVGDSKCVHNNINIRNNRQNQRFGARCEGEGKIQKAYLSLIQNGPASFE